MACVTASSSSPSSSSSLPVSPLPLPTTASRRPYISRTHTPSHFDFDIDIDIDVDIEATLDEANQFLDSSSDVDRALLSSPNSSNLATPQQTPPSSVVAPSASRKRVDFTTPFVKWGRQQYSIWPTENSSPVHRLPPSRERSEFTLKSILKPPPPLPPPEDLQTAPEMLSHALNGLASSSRDHRLSAYIALYDLLAAYENFPDAESLLIAEQSPLLGYIHRDMVATLPDGKPDVTFILKVLKVLAYLFRKLRFGDVVNRECVAILNRSIGVLKDSNVTPLIAQTHLEVLAHQSFSAPVLTAEHVGTIVAILRTIYKDDASKPAGKVAVTNRLAVYRRLVIQAPDAMNARVSQWLSIVVAEMTRTLLEGIKQMAAEVGYTTAILLGHRKEASNEMIRILGRKDKRTESATPYCRTVVSEMERMLADNENNESVMVPSLWSVPILFMRHSKPSTWDQFELWLTVIKRCLNNRDPKVRLAALKAWSKLIFAERPDHRTPDQVWRLLQAPIENSFSVMKSEDFTRPLGRAAVSTYCTLLFFTLPPSAGPEQLERCWNECVERVMVVLRNGTLKHKILACQILTALFGSSAPWQETRPDKVNWNLSIEDLPRLSSNWVRDRLDKILEVVLPLLQHEGHATNSAEAMTTSDETTLREQSEIMWSTLMEAVHNAGKDKEVLVTLDLKTAIARTTHILSRLWSSYSFCSPSSESTILRFGRLMEVAMEKLGVKNFVEKYVTQGPSGVLEGAAGSPAHRNQTKQSAYLHLTEFLARSFLFSSSPLCGNTTLLDVTNALWTRCLDSRTSRFLGLDYLSDLAATTIVPLMQLQQDGKTIADVQSAEAIFSLIMKLSNRTLSRFDFASVQATPVGQDYERLQDLLEVSLQYTKSDFTVIEDLYARMVSCIKAEADVGGLMLAVTEPHARLFCQYLDAARKTGEKNISTAYAIIIIQHDTRPKNHAALISANNRLWRVSSDRKVREVEYVELYRLISKTLAYLYESYDGSPSLATPLVKFIGALIGHVDRTAHQQPTIIPSIQDDIALLLRDKGNKIFVKTSRNKDLIGKISSLWKIIDKRLFKAVAPAQHQQWLNRFDVLIAAGLSCRGRTITNETIVFWNDTFGKEEGLVHPPNITRALQKLANVVEEQIVVEEPIVVELPNAVEGLAPIPGWTQKIPISLQSSSPSARHDALAVATKRPKVPISSSRNLVPSSPPSSPRPGIARPMQNLLSIGRKAAPSHEKTDLLFANALKARNPLENQTENLVASGHLSAKFRAEQTVQSTKARMGDSLSGSVNAGRRGAGKVWKSTTPRTKPRHEDSKIEFETINSSPLQQQESQLLTDHQKEVAERQRVLTPGLFAGISSPASKFGMIFGHSPIRNETSDNIPSTPVVVHGLDDDHTPSSPILASESRRRTLSRKLTSSETISSPRRFVDDAEIPSSPPAEVEEDQLEQEVNRQEDDVRKTTSEPTVDDEERLDLPKPHQDIAVQEETPEPTVIGDSSVENAQQTSALLSADAIQPADITAKTAILIDSNEIDASLPNGTAGSATRPSAEAQSFVAPETQVPTKRGRGRPRKSDSQSQQSLSQSQSQSDRQPLPLPHLHSQLPLDSQASPRVVVPPESAPKRGRGRPRKSGGQDSSLVKPTPQMIQTHVFDPQQEVTLPESSAKRKRGQSSKSEWPTKRAMLQRGSSSKSAVSDMVSDNDSNIDVPKTSSANVADEAKEEEDEEPIEEVTPRSIRGTRALRVNYRVLAKMGKNWTKQALQSINPEMTPVAESSKKPSASTRRTSSRFSQTQDPKQLENAAAITRLRQLKRKQLHIDEADTIDPTVGASPSRKRRKVAKIATPPSKSSAAQATYVSITPGNSEGREKDLVLGPVDEDSLDLQMEQDQASVRSASEILPFSIITSIPERLDDLRNTLTETRGKFVPLASRTEEEVTASEPTHLETNKVSEIQDKQIPPLETDIRQGEEELVERELKKQQELERQEELERLQKSARQQLESEREQELVRRQESSRQRKAAKHEELARQQEAKQQEKAEQALEKLVELQKLAREEELIRLQELAKHQELARQQDFPYPQELVELQTLVSQQEQELDIRWRGHGPISIEKPMRVLIGKREDLINILPTRRDLWEREAAFERQWLSEQGLLEPLESPEQPKQQELSEEQTLLDRPELSFAEGPEHVESVYQESGKEEQRRTTPAEAQTPSPSLTKAQGEDPATQTGVQRSGRKILTPMSPRTWLAKFKQLVGWAEPLDFNEAEKREFSDEVFKAQMAVMANKK